jgi:hypothetical protein
MEPSADLFENAEKDAWLYHARDGDDNELPFFLRLSVYGGNLMKEYHDGDWSINPFVVERPCNFLLDTLIFKNEKEYNDFMIKEKGLIDENANRNLSNIDSIFRGWKPNSVYKPKK